MTGTNNVESDQHKSGRVKLDGYIMCSCIC